MGIEKPPADPGSPATPSPETKTAIIIGAGPAGLTAAYELLTRTNIKPVVLESSSAMGGISRTVNYKGNRIDIGGHRFFSKSDRVVNWWLSHLPLEGRSGPQRIAYHGMTREVAPSDNGNLSAPSDDLVMLLRKRESRIYFLRRFFAYPITLSFDTLRKLGLVRTVRAGCSYLRSAVFPLKDVENLEQFFINRFGRELYRTFFKSYTEKVWGISCREISAEWGEQRVKGLSIAKTILHGLRKPLRALRLAPKETETSFIEQFLYPKRGPGQMWETVAQKVLAMGGEIRTGMTVTGVHYQGSRVSAVGAVDRQGCETLFPADYFFSTMAIKDLVRAMEPGVPPNVREISDGLQYRDFIIVGLLVKKLKVVGANHQPIEDNWIYIQEPEVQAARLQIFNNWSPDMVADENHMWIGAEYFCQETDRIWNLPDAEMAQLAARELHTIGILPDREVLDSVVIRMPKTYPAYFGTYRRFAELRGFLDRFENLFLVGRNGMHRYNNQDHSMLTAMLAVDNLLAGRLDKSNLWDVNTEMEYHESAQPPPELREARPRS